MRSIVTQPFGPPECRRDLCLGLGECSDNRQVANSATAKLIASVTLLELLRFRFLTSPFRNPGAKPDPTDRLERKLKQILPKAFPRRRRHLP